MHTFLKLFTASYNVENNKLSIFSISITLNQGALLVMYWYFQLTEKERFLIIILLTMMLYYMHFWSLFICLDNALVL